jgi:hypothetical protein
MNKEKQELLDSVYNNYVIIFEKEWIKRYDPMLGDFNHNGRPMTQEEFNIQCKNNPKFFEKLGLKIEERDLSLEERIQFFYKKDCSNGKPMADKILKEELKSERIVKTLDSLDIPTKLITITYNDKTIESYE